MNKYLKTILIYSFLIIPAIRLLATLLRNTWFYSIAGYLVPVAMFAMLFHIGKLMDNAQVRRKYFIYISAIAGEVIFFNLLSAILHVSLENTWLALVSVNILFITIFIALIDIAKMIKDSNEKVSRFLHRIAVVGVIGFVFTNVLVCVIGF